jgi:N6-adenosine-specific RNA methylase IME4
MGDLAKIEGFCELSTTNLTFKRDVSKEEWMDVFKALKQVEGCVQFWIGDCLAYRQQKWGMYDDIAEETGMDKGYLRDIKYVADNVELSLRNDNLSFSHHKEVASLPPEKQELFLNMAVEDKLSVRDLRNEIKKEKRNDEARHQSELPKQKFQVIYADPPWSYNDKCDSGAIQSGGVDKHYPTMSINEICELPISDLAEDDSVLFLWTTSPLLEDSFLVINAWGFNYKASFIWDKIKHNMGHYNSVRHEFLLIATRGSCTPDNMKLFDSVQSIERSEHSKKPHEFYEIIETLYSGSKIELFARNIRDGWSSWGNEV